MKKNRKYWRKRARKAERSVIRIFLKLWRVEDALEGVDKQLAEYSRARIDTGAALAEVDGLLEGAEGNHSVAVERLIEMRDVAVKNEDVTDSILRDTQAALESAGAWRPPLMPADAVRTLAHERDSLRMKLVELSLKPGDSPVSMNDFNVLCDHLGLAKEPMQSAMVGLGWLCDESGVWSHKDGRE